MWILLRNLRRLGKSGWIGQVVKAEAEDWWDVGKGTEVKVGEDVSVDAVLKTLEAVDYCEWCEKCGWVERIATKEPGRYVYRACPNCGDGGVQVTISTEICCGKCHRPKKGCGCTMPVGSYPAAEGSA